MVNKELLDYIRSESKRGVPQTTIRSLLIQNGWEVKDVDEAEHVLSSTPEIVAPKPITPLVQPIIKPIVQPIIQPTAKTESVAKPVEQVKPIEHKPVVPILEALKLKSFKPTEQSKPIERPQTQPITKPIVEPVVKVEPIAKVEPVIKPIVQPVIKTEPPVVKVEPIVKPAEIKPVEIKPIEIKPTDTKPVVTPPVQQAEQPAVKPTIQSKKVGQFIPTGDSVVVVDALRKALESFKPAVQPVAKPQVQQVVKKVAEPVTPIVEQTAQTIVQKPSTAPVLKKALEKFEESTFVAGAGKGEQVIQTKVGKPNPSPFIEQQSSSRLPPAEKPVPPQPKVTKQEVKPEEKIPVEQIYTPTPKIKRKLKLPLIITIIFLILLSGGVGYAYYTGYFVSMTKVSAQAYQSVREAASGAFETTVSIDMSGVKKQADILDTLPGFSPNISFEVSGAFDRNKKDSPLFSSLLSLRAGSFAIGAETRLVNKTMYLNASEIPAIPLVDLKGLKNKWVSFPWSKDSKLQDSLPFLGKTAADSPVFKKLSDEQKTYAADLAQNAHLVSVTKRHGETEMEGVPVYHFEFTLDQGGIYAFLSELEAYVHSIAKEDPVLLSYSTESISNDISKIRDFKGEAWIGKTDSLPYKLALTFASQEGEDATSLAQISINSLFSDWNTPVVVTTPNVSVPITTILGENPNATKPEPEKTPPVKEPVVPDPVPTPKPKPEPKPAPKPTPVPEPDPLPIPTDPDSDFDENSVVDFLDSLRRAIDFASRAELAKQYGIENYIGTAEQNIELLKKLQEANIR